MAHGGEAGWNVAVGRVRGRWNALYALDLYHPVATLARSGRRHSRALRGKDSPNEQPTRLPQVAWSDVLQRRRVALTEVRKRSGNVTPPELAILALAAAGCRAGSEIVEIGTFDGRTTLNLALNAPPGSPLFTLDLPPDRPTRFPLAAGESQYVEKPLSGARFRQCSPSLSDAARRITQLFGDSATFDWSDHYRKAALVFVDGSHAFDYARSDSTTALQLVAAGGTVLWHDYGVWQGVTHALEELERAENLGLRHIRGTSLVLWRAAETLASN